MTGLKNTQVISFLLEFHTPNQEEEVTRRLWCPPISQIPSLESGSETCDFPVD